jgi:hypothetical protein
MPTPRISGWAFWLVAGQRLRFPVKSASLPVLLILRYLPPVFRAAGEPGCGAAATSRRPAAPQPASHSPERRIGGAGSLMPGVADSAQIRLYEASTRDRGVEGPAWAAVVGSRIARSAAVPRRARSGRRAIGRPRQGAVELAENARLAAGRKGLSRSIVSYQRGGLTADSAQLTRAVRNLPVVRRSFISSLLH